MATTAVITIPGGTWVDGEIHRDAELRPLTGSDELLLASHAGTPAARANMLLSRCLERLGPERAVKPDDVRGLTIGDREALLLHLRRLTFGERLQCILDCPDCSEPMDIELAIGDLLVSPYPDPRASYETAVAGGGEKRLRFRLPTGGDQEAVANAAHEPGRAARALARRCTGRNLDADAVERLSELMARLDPQAEIVLSLRCPVCEHRASAAVDATDLLLRELNDDLSTLYREVHLLAFYYGWSEAEILGLPTSRRRLYLGLLADSLGETP